MSQESELSEITLNLKRLCAGDSSAEAPVAEAVYSRMRELARAVVFQQSGQRSVEPTSLANEVLLELIRLRSLEWQDRIHFFRVAARMMRRRFLDHIRAKRAKRRSPEGELVQLDEEILAPSEERFDEILFVDDALNRLSAYDGNLARTVELVYFGGFTIAEVAAAQGVSEKTIDRHLEFARRWMAAECGGCPSLAKRSASSGRA